MFWSLMVISLVAVTAGSTCIDRTSVAVCQGYKRAGYCTEQPKVMQFWCPKTCGYTCSTNTESPTVPPRPTKNPSTTCGRSSVQQSRVVNGVYAKEGAWPWLASLQNAWRKHWCGATLITPTWVLTASHCIAAMKGNEARWSIKLGAHDHSKTEVHSQRISIKRVIGHPNYNDTTLKSDLALIELSSPAKLNSRVNLACLPPKGVGPAIGSQDCYVAGWGSTQFPGKVTDVLRQARLPIVNSYLCVHQLEAICAGFGTAHNANACRGDSGGPFVCKQPDGSWRLDGVASYVKVYCKYYTGFSPVNKYMDWIESYIQGRI